MKRVTVKIICTLLVMIMTLSIVSPAALCAEGDTCECSFAPTVLINGLNTKDIVKGLGTDDMQTVFPPSGDLIKSEILNKQTLKGIGKFLITHDWDTLGDVLIPAANKIFADFACLDDGSVKPGTGIDWDYRTQTLPQQTNHRGDSYATFYYDWRIDPMEVARQLNVYIQRVIEATGHQKVNLVGFSMGSVITMAYVEQFGCGSIESVVLCAPAFNGVVTCSEPFAGMIDVEPIAVVRYIDDLLGDDAQSVFIKKLVNLLYKTKLLNLVSKFANKLVENLLDRVYDEAMTQSLATMPGLWSLVAHEQYETAKASMFKDTEKYSEIIDVIDNYHYNVQQKGDELIAQMLSNDVRFGIIAKYGSQLTPCIDSWDSMGDTVIDTSGESFGATCATVEGTLGEGYVQKNTVCGHNHLSADGKIDASTCKYPEYTWFVRDLLHSNSCEDLDELTEYILYSDEQVTVSDSARWKQFLLCDKQDESFSELTSDNAPEQQSVADYSAGRAIKEFFSALKDFIAEKNKAE